MKCGLQDSITSKFSINTVPNISPKVEGIITRAELQEHHIEMVYKAKMDNEKTALAR